MEYFDDIDEVY